MIRIFSLDSLRKVSAQTLHSHVDEDTPINMIQRGASVERVDLEQERDFNDIAYQGGLMWNSHTERFETLEQLLHPAGSPPPPPRTTLPPIPSPKADDTAEKKDDKKDDKKDASNSTDDKTKLIEEKDNDSPSIFDRITKFFSNFFPLFPDKSTNSTKSNSTNQTNSSLIQMRTYKIKRNLLTGGLFDTNFLDGQPGWVIGTVLIGVPIAFVCFVAGVIFWVYRFKIGLEPSAQSD